MNQQTVLAAETYVVEGRNVKYHMMIMMMIIIIIATLVILYYGIFIAQQLS